MAVVAMLSPVSKLTGAIHVVLGDAYGDGTVWFALEDSGKRRSHVCIDGRNESRTKHRLFDGARHPNDARAVLIELGAHEEGLIVSLASEWRDSAPPSDLGLNEFGWELIRNGLVRVGEPSV